MRISSVVRTVNPSIPPNNAFEKSNMSHIKLPMRMSKPIDGGARSKAHRAHKAHNGILRISIY
jgi:hypothetical protein